MPQGTWWPGPGDTVSVLFALSLCVPHCHHVPRAGGHGRHLRLRSTLGMGRLPTSVFIS